MRQRATLALLSFALLALSAAPALADDVKLTEALDPNLTGFDGGEVIHFGHDFVAAEGCGGAPSGLEMEHIAAGDTPSYRLKVFLNFDGAKLSTGQSNSINNSTGLLTQSTLDYLPQTWGSAGRDKTIKDILTELKLLYQNYAVEFVTTRPTSGDYTMVMIGGSGDGCKKGGPGTVGIAPLDCKNSNKNDIVLVFGAKLSSARSIAMVAAHEMGHSFGLEHVDDKKDVMYPALNGETCCWTNSTVNGSGTCGRTKQDAKKVLQDNLGVGEGDKILPRIWFVRPGGGAVLPPRFTFEVAAVDDLKVHHVDILIDGKKVSTVTGPPFTALAEGLSDGDHTLKAEVFDYKPNKASAEITITVDSKCVLQGDCSTGKSGLGQGCSSGDECSSGLCAIKGSVGYCAELCDSTNKLCPTGLTCTSISKDWACVKGTGYALDKASGGGCSMAGGRGAGALALLLALGLLLVARRRG